MSTWYIDPIGGDNGNTGESWAQAWLTIQHSFSAGDIIKVAKSSETPLTGTVTASNGSASVTTTNDLTGSLSQYSLIRIGSDDTFYMVWSVNSTTITINRPYRGSTGSGKGISSIAPFSKTTTNDWNVDSGTGTSGNLISLLGGYDTSTDVRDGFTIIDWGGAYNYVFPDSLYYWAFSHIYMTYPRSSCWYSASYCEFNNCGAYHNDNYDVFNYLRGCTVNNFHCQHFGLNYTYDSEINDLETGNSGYRAFDIGTTINTRVNRWKNAGWYSSIGMALNLESADILNVTFVDTIFDELGEGCNQIGVNNYAANFNNFVFINPQLGSGTLFRSYGNAWPFIGEIGLQHVDGDPTDNRRLICLGQPLPTANVEPIVLQQDMSVYRTTAPSAKITLNEWNWPCEITHYAPCDANIEYTISVYLRKNSSYGSDNLPLMRLKWFTGTDSNLTYNVHDESMSDVDDTFSQVQYSVTPGVTGTIEIGIVFQSEASGAIAWYDDLEIN